MAQSMMNAVMAAGDAGTMLPIDAIDEFKTQQNPRAEYGWKPGAVVNVGIKSGTNAIHGTAYAYGRSDSFDARNYFNTDVKSNSNCVADPFPCTKSPVELEQYGASIGGPIKKDKLFYFGNYESQRYSVGNPIQHVVPITDINNTTSTKGLIGACQAALDLGAPGTAGGLTALSAQLAGITVGPVATGHPNGTCVNGSNYPGIFPINNGTTNNLNTSLVSTSRIYSGVGKIDYHINDKHTLNGMYFISPGRGTFVDDPTNQIAPQWLTVEYARSMVGSVGWTYVPNSKWVNSFRFGYSHYFQDFYSPDHNDPANNYTLNGSTYNLTTGVDYAAHPERQGFPEIQFHHQGYSFLLGASWPKTVGPDGVWQFSDSVSYLRGNHAFKFGGEVLVNQSTSSVTSNTKGQLRFGNTGDKPVLQNFFTGTLDRARFTSGDFLRHLQSQGYGLFVQDDWRVTPRLTVNLGLRYELNTVMKEKNNVIGNFDPVKGPQQVGIGGVSGVYNGDHNNFGPRFGFAWDITGNGKTVVRGGGSVLYEQGSFDMFNGLGNIFGLRTEPTGVKLYCTIGTDPQCTSAGDTAVPGGTVNVSGVTFTDAFLTPVIDRWASNSPANPLFNSTPTCGDGTLTLPSGFTPTPCIILGVDRNLRTPYISTWSLGIQRALTNNLSIDISYVGNHATKLVGLTDLNQPLSSGGFSAGWGNPADPTSPAGLCIASAPNFGCSPDSGLEVVAQPYNTKFPYLSNILWLSNNNFSNYNSLQVSLTQRTAHGLSFVAGYTYAHALGESPDNWSFELPIDSNKVRALYGTTEFDVTHRFTFSTTYAIPGMKAPGQLLQGWSINSIVTLESATPWGINDTSTDFSGNNEINPDGSNGEQWNFYGNPADFRTTKAFLNTNPDSDNVPQLGIPYFAGTSNATCLIKAQAIGKLAVASLTDLGCYANGSAVLIPPAYGSVGNTSPNMFRGLPFYNVDLSVTKAFKFKERLTAQFRAEFFNLFNRPTISNPFGGPGGDNSFTDPSGAGGASFGFRGTTPDVLSSNPVLGSGGARAMQLGLKLIF
jgi:hypothetical protein